jgi:SAM-dependent methyltransferase
MDQRLLKKQQRANEQLLLSSRAPTLPSSSTAAIPVRRLLHKPSLNTTTMKRSQLKKKMPPLNSYLLTQSNDEQDRMVAQHYLLRTAFGADFSSPIRTQLHKGIVVLDVGCGPGTWTMEMSTAFPKSTFIGIDQSACYPRDIKPRNCHFRTCGSLVEQQELPFPDNSIDYIYQRDMNWGLTGQTWQPLLLEYQRILKPGGWIEFVEPVSK